MAEIDPLIGGKLGQYEIVAVLGKGGMATVYRGLQSSINRIVAIKVLPSILLHDDTFIGRFKREANVIAKLEHLHILPLYDYGEEGGRPYIVTRYLEGGTLDTIIRKGPMPWQDVVRIINQIASALDYAHSQGVIHRDIKPSNVMLDKQGNAYLTDFGIARVQEAAAELTGSTVIGTPAYMAPEQADGAPPTPAADVYALGCTLFEMISGRIPYPAETPIAQLMAHVQRPTPSLEDLNPSIPEDVARVVRRAMAKYPGERYMSAGELAKELSEAAEKAGGWVWKPLSPREAAKHARRQQDKQAAGQDSSKADLTFVLGKKPRPGARMPGPRLQDRINALLSSIGVPKTVRLTPENQWLWLGAGATTVALLVILIVLIVAGNGDVQRRAARHRPPQSELLYETDFTEGWAPITTQKSSSQSIVEGLRVSVGSNWAFWDRVPTINASTFYAEIAATAEQCETVQSAYGVMFHYRSENQFRRFMITCSGTYKLIDRDLPGGVNTLASGPLPGGIDPSKGLHVVAVRVREEQITLYVDGREIETVKIENTPEGQIGPYVDSGSSDTIIVFRQLMIYMLE